MWSHSTRTGSKEQSGNDRYFPDPFFFRYNHFAVVVFFMNADGLFHGRDSEPITDLSREEFAKELEQVGKQEVNPWKFY